MSRFLCAWAMYNREPVVFTRPAEGPPAPDPRLRDIREVEAPDANAAAVLYAAQLVTDGVIGAEEIRASVARSRPS